MTQKASIPIPKKLRPTFAPPSLHLRSTFARLMETERSTSPASKEPAWDNFYGTDFVKILLGERLAITFFKESRDKDLP